MRNENRILAHNLFKTTPKKLTLCKIENRVRRNIYTARTNGIIFSYACKIMPHMEGQ